MRSSARNLVSSVSPIGSGSSTRSMAPGSSVGVIRTGESTLLWTFKGPRRSRSSPLLRCGAVGGRPGVTVPSSRPGHARRARRGASRSVRRRRSLMPPSMLWTTSPDLVSPRVRLAHRRALYRWSSSFVARSMPSWPSATINGITRRGFSLSRKPAAASPIEPVDVRAIRAVACTRTPSCTVSYSLHCTTRRVPDRVRRPRPRLFRTGSSRSWWQPAGTATSPDHPGPAGRRACGAGPRWRAGAAAPAAASPGRCATARASPRAGRRAGTTADNEHYVK